MASEKAPQSPFEVDIAIGGDDWEYIVRTMQKLAAHLKECGPECNMISGGGGGRHGVTVRRRDVSVDQYHRELMEWCGHEVTDD